MGYVPVNRFTGKDVGSMCLRRKKIKVKIKIRPIQRKSKKKKKQKEPVDSGIESPNISIEIISISCYHTFTEHSNTFHNVAIVFVRIWKDTSMSQSHEAQTHFGWPTKKETTPRVIFGGFFLLWTYATYKSSSLNFIILKLQTVYIASLILSQFYIRKLTLYFTSSFFLCWKYCSKTNSSSLIVEIVGIAISIIETKRMIKTKCLLYHIPKNSQCKAMWG